MSILYFPEHKLEYVKIPKNACSTIIRTLAGEKYEGVSPHDYDNKVFGTAPASLTDWDTLVVIRNPYERLISAYLNKVIKPESGADFSRKLISEVLKNRHQTNYKGGIATVTFKEFVEYVCAREDHLLDQHWRSQSSFLSKEPTILINFANLNSDWQSHDKLKTIKRVDYAPHATTSNYEVTHNLSTIAGEYIAGYVTICRTYPPKSCFNNDYLESIVKKRFSSDYELYKKASDDMP